MRLSEVALTTRWWRFDKYEIQDGYIRPAAGAQLKEYDFFEDYLAPHREAKRKSRAEEPGPHEDLANLDLNSDSDILAWVHDWGLLGILPHTVEHVAFESGVLLFRAAPNWHHDSTNEDACLPAGPGTAVVRELATGRWFSKPAHMVLDKFFTNIPYGVYPVPYSDDFWQFYAEPVSEFQAVARNLRRVILGLQGRSGHKSGTTQWAAYEEFWRAQQWIGANALLAPPQEVPWRARSTKPILFAPTLLAVLVAMVWLDTGQGKDVQVCAKPGCGKVYFTRHSERLYCSDRCKKAEEMRRYRQKLKAADAGNDSPPEVK